jgi:hypothetical protein
MGKKKRIESRQWHERPVIPWLKIANNNEGQQDAPAWVQKYLDLADRMLKSSKKTERKTNHPRAA